MKGVISIIIVVVGLLVSSQAGASSSIVEQNLANMKTLLAKSQESTKQNIQNLQQQVSLRGASNVNANLLTVQQAIKNAQANADALNKLMDEMLNSLKAGNQGNNNNNGNNSNGNNNNNNPPKPNDNNNPKPDPINNETNNNTSPNQGENNGTPNQNDSSPQQNTSDPVVVPNNTNSSSDSNSSQPEENPQSVEGMSFTLAQLEEIMPYSGNRSAYYYPYLTKAMSAGRINNCPRIAAFLAQIGHESGSLVYTTEIADGSAYEGIADIGNTSPGDGVRYKGRGVIQVTGKYNYQIVSQGLGYDFVSNPEELANVPWCIDSAVWWWNNHSLSEIADANTQESFDRTTRIINGGYNGKADRDSRWATAKRVLGC